MADLPLADRVISLLNDLLERDPPAVAAMMANRVPCNESVAGHPSVIVRAQHGGWSLGLLGLLNGLCGLLDDRRGPIAMIWDGDALIGFCRTADTHTAADTEGGRDIAT